MATGNHQPNEFFGCDSCSLCRMFRREGVNGNGSWNFSCDGCPIMEHTGKKGCAGTPHDKLDEAEYMHLRARMNGESIHDDFRDTPEFQTIAEEELNFLKSLLETKTP